MKMRRVAPLVALVAALLSCTRVGGPIRPAPPAEQTDDPAPAPGRLPTDVRPSSYSLLLEIDPTREGFSGSVRIVMNLAERRRYVWLHAQDLKVDRAWLDGTTDQDVPTQVFADLGLLRIDLGAMHDAGELGLTIEFSADYAEGLAGLFKHTARDHSYAFTQFEALDARRAFPCFDEPSFKTPFEVSLVVNKDDVAISNAPILSESPAVDRTTMRPREDGKRVVRFHPTEKLPTYLVAFAVGPFDVVEASPIPANAVRKDPIPLRGVAPRGQGKNLAFALEETPKLLLELERYFGTAYPFAKLDLIAVPDFDAGAMENAGAITFRDTLLLVDPVSGTEDQRRDVVAVASHELAHQWFGNLVTMAWWDDLWLNEAFASWMGQRTVALLHPGWEVELETLGGIQRAMDSDSLKSARAIRQPILSEDDVENAFDDLTYEKGAGLIAMYERYLGPDAFRDGVRRYLDKHRFGSATTEDFLAAVFVGAPPEVAQSFRDFLDRAGVPALALVSDGSVCAAGKAQEIQIRTARFMPLGSEADATLKGKLPLCIRVAGGPPSCSLVDLGTTSTMPITTKSGDCPEWVFPNEKGVAYARWTPTPDQLQKLMKTGYKSLTPSERLATVDAMRAGVRSGSVDLDAVLAVLPTIAADGSREVAFAPTDMVELAGRSVAEPDRPKLERYVASTYGPLFKKTGWKGHDAGPNTAVIRRQAFELVGVLGRDPAVRKEAVKRARTFLGVGARGTLDAAALSPELVRNALVIAVQDGGAEVYDAALAQLRATEDPLLRRQLVLALMRVRSPELMTRSRALVLDGTLMQSETLRALFELFENREGVEATWSWVAANLEALAARMPAGARGVLPSLVEGLCDARREEEVRKAFAPFLTRFVGAPRTLENAVERMRICHAIRERQAPAVQRFLAKR